MYGEDEWKCQDKKTTYSTNEKDITSPSAVVLAIYFALFQDVKFLYVSDVTTIYITDVKQLFIPRKFDIFSEHDHREGSLRFENFRGM